MVISSTRVSVILACHNRVEQTILCLEKLMLNPPADWLLEIVLVDDGSSDGTGQTVKQQFPKIQIIHGPGDWYWARSMHEAQKRVDIDSDYLLLLNDDVELFPQALSEVGQIAKRYPEDVLVGQLSSKAGALLSYGALSRVGRHPLKYKIIENPISTTEIDVFHGNFVCIPMAIVRQVGLIDGTFDHAYADYDYALRIRGAGFTIRTIPGFVGYCEPHSQEWPTNVYSRLKWVFSKKGLPWRSQMRFLKRHGPVEWPLYFILPYVRAIFGIKGKFDVH